MEQKVKNVIQRQRNKKFAELIENEETSELALTLLNSIWIMRAIKGRGFHAVLTTEEAETIVVDFFKELEKGKFEIVKKEQA